MAAKRVPTLSAEQLSEVLSLMKGADSVELKLSVPDADQRSVVDVLEMDPVGAQIRQVAFFDTPDLALDKVGVVVRARRIQGKPADSVVKLRPVKPDELSPSLRKTAGFGVEVDAMPGGFVCSASMKGAADPVVARDVFRGRQPLRKLFTKDQRALLRTACSGRSATRRPGDARSGQSSQAQVHTRDLWPKDGRRAVDVSRRHSPPRAVDEVHS